MTVLKQADSKVPHLEALAALLARDDLDARLRKKVEDEVWAVRVGAQGEREAAYAINFEYADREGYIVIHDLRLEFGGRVAQIDHLLINLALDVWVCETKAFSEGVRIDERGHWYRYGGRYPHGVESPVKQNAQHVKVLNDLFRKDAVRLPRRVVTLRPTIFPVVLISSNARIDLPKSKRAAAAIEGIETVIKVEELVDTIERSIDQRNAVRLLAKAVGPGTILDIGQQLVGMHRPIVPDYAARFGLSGPGALSREATTAIPRPTVRPTSDRTCELCGRLVTPKVAQYSTDNAERFGGRILCYDCQHAAWPPRPQRVSDRG